MHFIKLIFCVCLICFSSLLFAGNPDSLLQVIRSTDDQHERMQTRLALGELLRGSMPDSAIRLAQLVREDALETNDSSSLVSSYLLEAMSLQMMGELESSLEAGRIALEKATQFQSVQQAGKARLQMGGILAKQGSSEESRVQLFKSIESFQESGDSISWGLALNVIGSTFFQDGNIDRAEEYYQKSVRFFRSQNFKRGTVGSQLMLANIALEKKDLDKALSMYQSLVAYYEQINESYMLGVLYNNIGVVHQQREEYDKTLESYNRSLEYRRVIGNKDGISITLSSIANIYQLTGERDKAIETYRETLGIAAEIRSFSLMRSVLRQLSKLYREVDPGMALFYQDSSLVVDSILTDQARKAEAAELEARYQNEQQEIEIELLRKTQALEAVRRERAEQFGYALGGGVVLLLLVIAVVIYFSIRTSRLNRSLQTSIQEQQAASNKLKAINQELNTLLHRSSHDIKSPLNSVQGLITVMRDMQGSEPFVPYLEMIESRLLKLKEFVSNLLMSGNIDPDEVRMEQVDAGRVLDAVIADLENMKGFEEITIHREFNFRESFRSEPNVLRSTMQNLISNAVKYRKLDSADAQCWVRLDRVGQELKLEVEDNGIGMKPEHLDQLFEQFSRFSIQSEGSGVGLYLVRKGLEKIGARIEVASEEGKGSVFCVFLPLENE